MEVMLEDFEGNDERTDQLFLQGFALRANGQFEAAVERYKGVIESFPGHIQARVNLGVCYMKLGQYELARETYEARPVDDYRVLFNLAILYIQRDEGEKARFCLESAVKLTPEKHRKAVERLLLDSRVRPTLPTEGSLSDLRPVLPKTSHLPLRQTLISDDKKTDNSTELEPKRVTWSRRIHTVKDEEIRPYTSWNTRVFPDFHVERRILTESISVPNLVKRKRKATLKLRGVPTPPPPPSGPKLTPLQRVHVLGALVQEDLEDEQALKQAEVDPTRVYSLKIKSLELSDALRKDLNRLAAGRNLLPDPDLDSILQYKLSDEALATARGEFTKPSLDRDYNLLLFLLSKLKFFAKFQTDVRVKFLQIGQVQGFSQGQEIFHQGDQGDLMFVILHGSVTVKRESPDFGSDPVIVNTLHDGDSFGELTMFGTQIKGSPEGRTATCIAAEKTDLLAIPKDNYQRIMMYEIETQLETKINFLLSLPFIHNVQQFGLIPVASNMEMKVFNFNEVILAKGDIPCGLHIILSGHCSVYSEGYCVRPRRLQGYATARIRLQPAENFQFGISHTMRFKKAKKKEPDEVPLRALSWEVISSTPGLKEDIQRFLQIQDLPSTLKRNFITREKLLRTQLKENDFFGGRALLDYNENETVAPCKFSVIAESSQVTVFLITKSLLPLMGEKLMEQIKRFMQGWNEPDCPIDVTESDILREFNTWNAYKAQVIDSARKQQFLEKTENRGKSAQQLL